MIHSLRLCIDRRIGDGKSRLPERLRLSLRMPKGGFLASSIGGDFKKISFQYSDMI